MTQSTLRRRKQRLRARADRSQVHWRTVATDLAFCQTNPMRILRRLDPDPHNTTCRSCLKGLQRIRAILQDPHPPRPLYEAAIRVYFPTLLHYGDPVIAPRLDLPA